MKLNLNILYIRIYSIFLLLISGISVKGQISNYSFMQGIYSDQSQYYVYVNAYPNPYYAYQNNLHIPSSSTNPLTVLYTGNGTGTIGGSATGAGYPIGFNFIYNGESFDRVVVSGNGYIKLGHSSTPITIKNDSLLSSIFDGSIDNQNILASFQLNAISFTANNNAPLLVMYGVPGNRTFVVQFSDVTATGTAIVHQIQLQERNNNIGFAYTEEDNYSNAYLQGAIGITSNNSFSNLKIVTGTNTWQTATEGSSFNNLCDYNNSNLPPNTGYANKAFMYIWTPPTPSPSAPTCPFVYFLSADTTGFPSNNNILWGGATTSYASSTYYMLVNGATNVATNPTINWSDASVTSNQTTTYDVYLDIDNPPLIPVAQNLTTTSYTPATLVPKTKYYYNVVPKNASGKDSACVGSFITDSLPQYCSVIYGSGRVNSFTVNTLSYANSSSNNLIKLPATAPYITTLQRDTDYTCTITLNSLYANTYPFSNTTNVKVWVDFNQDGYFDDPGEAVGSGSAGLNGTITFPISIPNTAKLGATIMRLAWEPGSFDPLAPCTNYDLGGADEDFTITIAPSTSCQSFTISPVVNNVNCFGQTNGSITLNPSGGATPYTVSWTDGGSTNATRNNLAKGIYQASVTDANNCEVAIPLTPVFEPAALSIDTATSNNITSILVSGGTMPYSYLWSNGDTLSNSNNLAAGTYSVTVTDAHGCDTTMQNIIVTKVTTDTIPPPPTGGDSTSADSSIAIVVYPNPTSGIIHLQSQVQQTIHVVIVSEEGKVIQKDDYTIGTNSAASINVSAFSAGIYFLDIVGDKSSKVVKIIRE